MHERGNFATQLSLKCLVGQRGEVPRDSIAYVIIAAQGYEHC